MSRLYTLSGLGAPALCIFNRPNNIQNMFNTFYEEMTEDIKGDKNEIKNTLLNEFQGLFKNHNISCNDFDFNTYRIYKNDIIDKYHQKDRFEEHFNNLNSEQKHALNQ